METHEYISIQLFCSHYDVPTSFVSALHEFELIEITRIKGIYYIHKTQIIEIEKMIRLHYDLDINLEGVDAIYNLLKQVKSLQEEIVLLNNKLNRFKDI